MTAKEYFIEELSGEPLTQDSVIEGLEEYSQQIAVEFCRWIVANPEMKYFSSITKETAEYYFNEFLKRKQ